MTASDGRFLTSALERFWELRERDARSLELRGKLERVLESEGPRIPVQELRDLVVLMLYWGTALDVREIAGLTRGQLESAEMGRFKVRIERRRGAPMVQALPAEASAALRLYLGRTPGEGPLFRGESGAPLSESELGDLVQRHASGLLLGAAGEGEGLLDHPVVLPTPTRLGAHPRYTGRGVTIAFVDSAFHGHPDLVRPRNRIKSHVDLTGLGRDLTFTGADAWHGTMTSVACAGNGYLSNGLYRGIAREAEVVLVAVGREGRVADLDVARAFEWLLERREALGIDIVSVSLGGDQAGSWRRSRIDELAELLVQAGVVVVAAAGNDPLRPSRPPADAPSVLTVGGLIDKNLPHEMTFVAYRSQFGVTVDGLLKPEVVAPGALVAAPLLPGTPAFEKARTLYFSRALPDDELRAELRRHPGMGFDDLEALDDEAVRERLEAEIRGLKLVGPHYQHVDGTSFAAPVVASVVAQMLEANPTLTPAAVRDILIQTARPIPHIPRERQGYGLVQPADAVHAAANPELPHQVASWATPRVDGPRATFRFRREHEGRVCVAGSWNGWDQHANVLGRSADGAWETTLEMQLPGRHTYKFVLDGQYWVEDPENPRTEPDGYGGHNSVFETAEHAFAEELPGRVFEALQRGAGEERSVALSALDFALGLPNASLNRRVQEYWQRALEAALDRLQGPPPTRGVELIQLYNCGLLLRSAQGCLGIDVVSGRHVWGVNWRLPEELVLRLAHALDALLVTQRLPDHLDLDVARLVRERGKPVGVPEEVRASVFPDALGFAPGARREIALSGGEIAVRAHRAHHWWDEEGCVEQRGYEVRMGGLRVVHLADHDPLRFLDFAAAPDVLVGTLGRFSPESGPLDSVRALCGLRPRLLVPAHVAELGQPGYGDEDGYDAVEGWLREAAGDVPWRVLTWGESCRIEPA
jgi:serine protease AprX